MLSPQVYAFISVVAVSLISLLGLFALSRSVENLRRNVFIFVSLAVGALLGDAFIHIIPESFESALNPLTTSILIIAGIILFFAIEKFLHWHHHGDDAEDNHIHPVGRLILISDGVHNFIDGVIIAVSFLVSPAVGFATTVAVILHEIPQEIGDFGVLLHAGYSKKKALFLNFLSALTSIIGAGFAFLIAENADKFTAVALPIAAGGFIYIAMADLLPELNKNKDNKHSIYQMLAATIGVLSMVALAVLD